MFSTKKPSGLGFHLLLLAGVALATGALRVGLKDWYAREFREVGQKAAREGAREIEAAWRRLPYADATRPTFADEFLAKIDWPALQLSETQGARLRTRLGELLRYFQNPTFEEYHRLKTEGVHHRFKLSAAAEVLLAKAGPPAKAGEPQDPKETARFVWNAVHTRAGEVKPPRITAVCQDRVAAALSHTNSPWSLLSGKVGKGFTKAGEALDPGFEYATEGGPSAADARGPVFFHLSFFAKANGSENAGPVYVSLCWLPEDQNWGLSRIIADVWLDFRTVF